MTQDRYRGQKCTPKVGHKTFGVHFDVRCGGCLFEEVDVGEEGVDAGLGPDGPVDLLYECLGV